MQVTLEAIFFFGGSALAFLGIFTVGRALVSKMNKARKTAPKE